MAVNDWEEVPVNDWEEVPVSNTSTTPGIDPYNLPESERQRMQKDFVRKQGSMSTQLKEAFKSPSSAIETLTGPTEPAKGVVDWATRVAPESTGKLIPRTVAALATTGKDIVTPYIEAVDNIRQGYPVLDSFAKGVKESYAATGKGIYDLADFATSRIGLQGLGKAWEGIVSDPAGTALVAKGGWEGAKRGGKAALSAIPENFERGLYKRGLKGQGPFSGLKIDEYNRRLDTALDEKIPLNEKGVNRLKDTVKGINEEVKGRIKQYADAGYTVPIDSVTAPVSGLRAKASGEAFPAKANAQINATVNEFMGNPNISQPGFDAATTRQAAEIPIDQAQTFKVSINRELNDFYDAMNKSPDKAGYLARQWVAKTKAAIGDGLRNAIGEIIPEIQPQLKREGGLLQLNKSLEKAVNRIGQRDILSLKFINSLAVNPKLAISEFILNNPSIMSNVAIAIRQSRVKAGLRKGSNPGKVPTSPISPLPHNQPSNPLAGKVNTMQPIVVNQPPSPLEGKVNTMPPPMSVPTVSPLAGRVNTIPAQPIAVNVEPYFRTVNGKPDPLGIR